MLFPPCRELKINAYITDLLKASLPCDFHLVRGSELKLLSFQQRRISIYISSEIEGRKRDLSDLSS